MVRQPIFLLSLPRAGSTFVQRVLATHEEICTAAEPWILLPQLYALRSRGVVTEYNQEMSAQAIQDFIEELPGGMDTYRDELRRFVIRLYNDACGEKGRYFLDKSPRYHLIVHELFELFQDAKFIFLWRNPLAVLASSNETWAGGRWSVHRWEIDLFDGLANLQSAYERYRDRACGVRFEDLIAEPADTWPRVFEYLELSFDPQALREFASVPLRGRMGDPSGRVQYQAISREPLDKWKRSLGNPYRKAWCRRYLEWIGERRLSLMGYRLDDLIRELDGTPSSPRLLASDLMRAAYGKTKSILRRIPLR
jgi:hypothetical protein